MKKDKDIVASIVTFWPIILFSLFIGAIIEAEYKHGQNNQIKNSSSTNITSSSPVWGPVLYRR